MKSNQTVAPTDSSLAAISEKVQRGIRLDAADGLALYRSPDLIGIGAMADAVRRSRHNRNAFFVYNQHINYTNVCINRCKFCAFARDKGDDGAYTMTVEDVAERISARKEEPVQEIHMVGGINPDLPFDYYIELLATIRCLRPKATIKAFTAVEIDHLARLSGHTVADTLDELKKAGLSMVPGGGAEVMSDRVRNALFPNKINGDRWLEVTEEIHRSGLISNATMLYGHMETKEERIAHFIRLRELQDRTGGFSAFIPLAFHSKNTGLDNLAQTTAFDDLKTIAIARLMLDNFEHIKAYWVMIGEKLAQVALSFGADDLDGTIIEETITHMAGAQSAKGLTRTQIHDMITDAGYFPVERDAFYQPVFSN